MKFTIWDEGTDTARDYDAPRVEDAVNAYMDDAEGEGASFSDAFSLKVRTGDAGWTRYRVRAERVREVTVSRDEMCDDPTPPADTDD